MTKVISFTYLKTIDHFIVKAIFTYHYQYYLVVDYILNIIISGTIIEILAVLRHYFHVDLKASIILKMDGNETISDRTDQILFKYFKCGDLYLKIRPRLG